MKLMPSKRFFYIALAAVAAVLVAFYTIREFAGPFLPQVIDENFFTGVIVVLMGLFLWNRQARNEEGKAAPPAEAGKAAADGSADAAARGPADPAGEGAAKDVDARG